MFAGLPGTGIGGIFYLLLTLWMPVHELYLTARGRSSAERWRFIAYRWAVFASRTRQLPSRSRTMRAKRS